MESLVGTVALLSCASRIPKYEERHALFLSLNKFVGDISTRKCSFDYERLLSASAIAALLAYLVLSHFRRWCSIDILPASVRSSKGHENETFASSSVAIGRSHHREGGCGSAGEVGVPVLAAINLRSCSCGDVEAPAASGSACICCTSALTLKCCPLHRGDPTEPAVNIAFNETRKTSMVHQAAQC